MLPLLFVVRLAILVYIFYFMLYKDLIPHFKVLYNLNDTNWWKSKDEPFFTNSSILNAFFCWFFWILFCILALLLVVLGMFLTYLVSESILTRKLRPLEKNWELIKDNTEGGPFRALYYYFAGYSRFQECRFPKKFIAHTNKVSSG